MTYYANGSSANGDQDLSGLRGGPILELPIEAIRPSPLNDKLYRPVCPNDPDVVALAESIREHGLKEPLVVTEDDVILSGHRRYAACRRLRLRTVRCRREPIRSTDPAFPRVLVAFNQQRVKSFDEQLREEVLRADPEEAHRRLRRHRLERSRVRAETVPIEGVTKRAKISPAKKPFLDAILRVLEEQREFWPLSDRRIHYSLLNAPPLIHAAKPDSIYRNVLKCYKSLCELLTRARLQRHIPFEAIHDPTRPVTIWDVYPHPQQFVREQLENFLQGYYRDLLGSQPNHVEIIGEKNTVEPTIRPVAMDFCIPVTIGRGYCSLPPRYEMARRFKRSGKERLILLVLSDFDPEGEDIGQSFARSMRDDFGIRAVDYIKVGLTLEQVRRLGLPPQMKAKETSSRFKKFSDRHGEDVFELEAAPPRELQRALREAIRSVLDVDAFNAEVEAEKRDAAFLEAARRRACESLGDIQDWD